MAFETNSAHGRLIDGFGSTYSKRFYGPFHVTVQFLYPLVKSENHFSDVFRGYRSETLV